MRTDVINWCIHINLMLILVPILWEASMHSALHYNLVFPILLRFNINNIKYTSPPIISLCLCGYKFSNELLTFTMPHIDVKVSITPMYHILIEFCFFDGVGGYLFWGCLGHLSWLCGLLLC